MIITIISISHISTKVETFAVNKLLFLIYATENNKATTEA